MSCCVPTGDVITVLNGLKNKKASGPAGISTRMLEATSASIAPSLCKLLNLSIQSYKIPTEWTLVNIVPVPKAKVSTKPVTTDPYPSLSGLRSP